jgi:hypothetical protein
VSAPGPPVVVTAAPVEAARYMRELLDDYFAELEEGVEESRITIVPLTDVKRGTVFYRVIQVSRTVAARFPDATLYVITEDGNSWRLPPPPVL